MSEAGNYDLKAKPPDDYLCPVSMELLLKANQTSCCGSHLSEQVASALERDGKPCPMCNSPSLKSTKDLYFRRLVGQVEVYCPKKPKGCKWEGAVQALDGHLGYGSVEAGDCKYVEVRCPYLCQRHVRRSKLKHHMKEECPKRPHTCNYCNFEGPHATVVNDHLPVCDKFPTRCPNNCDEIMCRAEVKRHLDTVCPLQPVKCEFEFAGCRSDRLHRKELRKHMDGNVQSHLEMLARHGKQREKEIEALKAQLQVLTNVVSKHLKQPTGAVAPSCLDVGFVRPPVMTLRNFQELHMRKEYWKSPAFYSHIGGYKMCLVVFPGSEVDQHGNEFMGVYMQMLRGEYDDNLKWPFYGRVEVRMLNQSGEKGHVDRVLLEAASYTRENFHINMVERVMDGATPSVWGCGNFIPHKSLRYNQTVHTQYLKDDAIDFQILSVSLLDHKPT